MGILYSIPLSEKNIRFHIRYPKNPPDIQKIHPNYCPTSFGRSADRILSAPFAPLASSLAPSLSQPQQRHGETTWQRSTVEVEAGKKREKWRRGGDGEREREGGR